MGGKHLLSAVVAAAVALGGGPAYADSIGAGLGTANSCYGLHCLQVSISMRVQPTGVGYNVVEFERTAAALPDAASTGIDQCSVGDATALLTPNNFPGAYATAVGVTVLPAGAAVTVCAVGHAHFMENVLGPGYLTAGGCTKDVVIQLPDSGR